MIIECKNCQTKNSIGEGEIRKAICAKCGINLVEKRMNTVQPISIGRSEKIKTKIIKNTWNESLESKLNKALEDLMGEVIDIKYSTVVTSFERDVNGINCCEIEHSAMIIYRIE